MQLRFALAVFLAVTGSLSPSPSQVPTRATTVAAVADAFATEPADFLLAVPGVANDFVLFADGQWLERADGTARLSAYALRLGALDRDLYVVLEFSGKVEPGEAGYPPAGGPVTTLNPAAYSPTGPVDPTTFTYYTQVSGTITGLRAFAGARIDVSNVGPVQLGAGASNKNVLLGMAVDLNLTVVQAPIAEAFAPTGPAQLRANLVTDQAMCATHIDGVPEFSSNPQRTAMVLPGVASDYLFLPVATFREAGDGSATLSGTVRRQSNYDDQWQLLLNLSNRIDPGAASHPPASGPVELSLPNTYASQGGPIDSSAWRYYTVASGTLVGTGDNSGSSIELTGIAPVQVGLGAGHDNIFFGIASTLAATVTQQPAGGSIILTGDIELRANLSVGCILPPPQVTGGSGQTIESLTHDKIVFTGSDLGFVEQAAIGQGVIANDDRQWFAGYVRVLDHQTVEVSIPQGLPAASYPVRLLNLNRTSNQVSINVQAPLTRRLRTENDRLPGEIQHWVTHQGDITGPAFAFVAVSMSNLPSSLPGVVDLQIGSQFSDLLILGAATQDPTSGSSVVLATTPANLAGFDLYSQSALMDQSFFPLLESDVWFTTY